MAKPRMGLMLAGFANALGHVCQADMVGAAKHLDQYAWLDVPPDEHLDALFRHLFAHMRGEENPDGISHLSSVAWRALALLEIEACTEPAP